MQNWSRDQNEAMRGYIILAASYMNADNRAEYGSDSITDATLSKLLRYLSRATDDMTADEAQRYYYKTDFN